MRRSELVAILFLLSGFFPVAAFAQQTPDANQASPAQAGQAQQQHPDQPQTQNFQPGQTQQPSGQAQTQSNKAGPSQSAQQTDHPHGQGQRSADNAGMNQDRTVQQQAEERIRRAEERMIINRVRQRLMEERGDQQTTGRNSHPDDDNMNPGPEYGSRYGAAAPGEGRYYDARPYPRMKTCIEYENGDEFCRYRAN